MLTLCLLHADANTWPSWGALRERVLSACREVSPADAATQRCDMLRNLAAAPARCCCAASAQNCPRTSGNGELSTAALCICCCNYCKQIRVTSAPSVRDAFAAEVVKLSPPLLKALDLSTCHNLHKLVLSPQVGRNRSTHAQTCGWPGFSSCTILEALRAACGCVCSMSSTPCAGILQLPSAWQACWIQQGHFSPSRAGCLPSSGDHQPQRLPQPRVRAGAEQQPDPH
jgi:hypothetical protein